LTKTYSWLQRFFIVLDNAEQTIAQARAASIDFVSTQATLKTVGKNRLLDSAASISPWERETKDDPNEPNKQQLPLCLHSLWDAKLVY
jgi:hypothetical protein